MKKTRPAFSLIEVIFAIVLLSMIALFLGPATMTNLSQSHQIKDLADTTFILQEAIELSRDKSIGTYTEEINGKNVEISVKNFQDPSLKSTYKKIRASYGGKFFELIEAQR
ncbi:type II secretion system protein [Anaerococcus lactolyticus]|uniref:type II secretion system protein n=1 Tax=Anaerococcus lactolyticus TaxID=33032 RepID=UPI0023F24FC9|nr:type II secretion system protein [Anaerococcus lactolyticus]